MKYAVNLNIFNFNWVAVATIAATSLFTGCAVQTPPVAIKEAPQAAAVQKARSLNGGFCELYGQGTINSLIRFLA
jgi:hypothetical protein